MELGFSAWLALQEVINQYEHSGTGAVGSAQQNISKKVSLKPMEIDYTSRLKLID